MSAKENKEVARRLYGTINDAIRTGNFESLDKVLDTTAEDHTPMPGQGPGREGIKDLFRSLRGSFPDLAFTVEDEVAEGDKVVVRVTCQGTHKGEFMGIPPTGKTVRQAGIDILRFSKGKAVERWGVFDDLSLMKQLGAIPTEESSRA